jgi:hypothetical protein
MRRTSLFALVIVCSFLMLAPGGPSVRTLESAAPSGPAVRAFPVAAPRPAAAPPLQLVGVTTEQFAVGAGALAVSRACNQEFPGTRLCEWGDIFRSIPPPALDGDVLVAPNYDVNPTTSCLSADGHVRCRPGTLIPAACCGTAGGSIAMIAMDLSVLEFATCSDVWNLRGTVLGSSGDPISGVLVSFVFQSDPPGTWAIQMSPGSVISGASGQVQTSVSLPSSCPVICAGGNNCSGTIVASYADGQIVSNVVQVVDLIP